MKKKSLFYKFFLVMALAIFSVAKAQTVNTEWATKINQTFAGMDKNKVPHSLLRDYAMEFTNLDALLIKEKQHYHNKSLLYLIDFIKITT